MRVITLDIWQPDCPIVHLSEVMEGVRFYIIMPHVVSKKTRVFFMVPSNRIKNTIEILNGHYSVRTVRVIWNEDGISGLEMICKTTNAMDTFLHSNIIFQKSYFAQDGHERWVVIVESKRAEREVIRELRESNEVSIIHREQVSDPTLALLLMGDPAIYSHLVSFLETKLSQTQQRILTESLERGYYDYPRKITLGEIANNIGISKVATLKNLRKLERIGMGILAELIRIRVFNMDDKIYY